MFDENLLTTLFTEKEINQLVDLELFETHPDPIDNDLLLSRNEIYKELLRFNEAI